MKTYTPTSQIEGFTITNENVHECFAAALNANHPGEDIILTPDEILEFHRNPPRLALFTSHD